MLPFLHIKLVGQDGWGVTYSSTEICALKGSTVNMSCTYRYPPTVQRVENRFWFRTVVKENYTDLKTDPEYSGRVQYNCVNNICILRITDLRESDSAEYKFRFITDQEGGKHSGLSGVTLSVTESPSAEIVEGSSVTLTCSSDANPAANYTWYKKNGDADLYPLSKEPQLVFSSIQSSDSGEYYCTAENKLWGKMSKYIYINVTYAPRLPSVSVSPSAEIVEGSSVTLTCSSDANPAAKYTWYKKNGDPDLQPLSKEPQLVFSSIQSSDSGEYYCTAENELGRRTSKYIYVNVTYAPKLPSVSVSPSAEIVEGSSVTLTCSSDANPAAKYTWYKEEQKLLQSPEGSYYLTSISSEDGGNYSCKAQNQHGQTSSSVDSDL
uniref:B-cell receptor CD22 n=1 Tax=Sparus aurata TaxID=8175 RepID=A0A671WP27_SPAAU